jgi:DNA-binding transcriptional MerR regulator
MLRLITVAHAARILETTERTVRRQAARGRLPLHGRTESGIRLFDRAEIERIAAERRARRQSDDDVDLDFDPDEIGD